LAQVGLAGESVSLLAVGGEEGQIVYTGGTGVQRSLDGGATWEQVLSEEEAPKVTALAVAPSDSQVTYVGVSEGCGETAPQPGYISRDGGDTWEPVGDNLLSLAIDPDDHETVYAVDCGGLKRSTDGGETWEMLDLPRLTTGTTAVIGIAPADPDQIYIAYTASAATMLIAHSTDRGATWAGITPDIEPDLEPDQVLPGGEKTVAGAQPLAIAVDAKNPAIVLASTNYGVFRSEDSGANWTRLDGGLENTALRRVSSNAPEGARLTSALVADPGRTGAFWVGTGIEKVEGVGLYRTRDSGASWRKPARGLEGKSIFALALGGIPGSRVLYIATDDGLWALSSP
jgi:photosystem II stability/assembly factor-like uncharacterized protein